MDQPSLTCDGPHFTWQATTPPHVDMQTSKAPTSTTLLIRVATVEFRHAESDDEKLVDKKIRTKSYNRCQRNAHTVSTCLK